MYIYQVKWNDGQWKQKENSELSFWNEIYGTNDEIRWNGVKKKWRLLKDFQKNRHWIQFINTETKWTQRVETT
jgi:hypothetical protein